MVQKPDFANHDSAGDRAVVVFLVHWGGFCRVTGPRPAGSSAEWRDSRPPRSSEIWRMRCLHGPYAVIAGFRAPQPPADCVGVTPQAREKIRSFANSASGRPDGARLAKRGSDNSLLTWGECRYLNHRTIARLR